MQIGDWEAFGKVLHSSLGPFSCPMHAVDFVLLLHIEQLD
jgi:hypothetical protein